MFKKILIVVGLLILIFVGVVLIQPNDFKITRSITISAPASAVFEQVNNFNNWEKWSPWAKLDPNSKATYEGPASGIGAKFGWSGNNQVGVGSNTIVDSLPNEVIIIDLVFEKPFKAKNGAQFDFRSVGNQTVVTWSMFGRNNFMSKAMGLIMNCDKMVGGQFEKGLASLKSIVESSSNSLLPLKLSIKTDKDTYKVGDEIKILFTVENTGGRTFNLNYHPYFSFDYEITILDNRKYERFPDQGSQQIEPDQEIKIELLPNGKWMREQTIARIGMDKVYKYKDPFSDDGKELYYDGFFIEDSTFNYKGSILVKNGSGKYGVTFKVCDGYTSGASYKSENCVKSELVEFQIQE